MLLLAIICTTPLSAAEAPWEKLRPGHPRVLATEADFAKLRSRLVSEPHLQPWWDRLVRGGQQLEKAAPSKYEIPDGKRLLAVSRRVLERISLLGLLHRMTGDARWSRRAWAELEFVSHYKDWNPSHFLDTAEMTAAFSLGYDWLFQAWSEDQKRVIREAILTLGLRPGQAIYAAPGRGWPACVHNWNQVCNGGMLMGALAVADEAPEVARSVVASALASLPRAMAEYAPDGGYREGPGYWAYGTGYNVLLLASLQSAFGSDLGLTAQPGFRSTAWFPIHCTSPSGHTFNFADAHEGGIGRNWAMPWLARQFKEPAFAAEAQKQSSLDAIQFLWAPGKESGMQKPALLGQAFREAEVVTLRTAWDDPNATWLAFKAGSPSFNHAQMDVGTFVFEMLGQRWAVDLGPDDYNAPGYFDTRSKRWSFYRNRAEGHNTLVINPTKGPDQERTSLSRLLNSNFSPGRLFSIADLTPAYGSRAKSVHRGVRISPNGAVLVQDEVISPSGPLWWFMHTAAAIEVGGNGRSASLKQGGKKLSVTLHAPDKAKFEILPTQPFPGTSPATGQRPLKGIQKLAVMLPSAETLQLAVLFSAENSPEPLQVVPLGKW